MYLLKAEKRQNPLRVFLPLDMCSKFEGQNVTITELKGIYFNTKRNSLETYRASTSCTSLFHVNVGNTRKGARHSICAVLLSLLCLFGVLGKHAPSLLSPAASSPRASVSSDSHRLNPLQAFGVKEQKILCWNLKQDVPYTGKAFISSYVILSQTSGGNLHFKGHLPLFTDT